MTARSDTVSCRRDHDPQTPIHTEPGTWRNKNRSSWSRLRLRTICRKHWQPLMHLTWCCQNTLKLLSNIVNFQYCIRAHLLLVTLHHLVPTLSTATSKSGYKKILIITHECKVRLLFFSLFTDPFRMLMLNHNIHKMEAAMKTQWQW